jgi:hypothetical protein
VSSHQENIDVYHFTKAELMQQVKAHKYLIILEEVLGVLDWDAIRVCLPDNENGSRIIVSTKQLRTALLCIEGTYQVSELMKFCDDQYLCAFSKKVINPTTTPSTSIVYFIPKYLKLLIFHGLQLVI